MPEQTDYLKRILNAPVYDVAIESPLEKAENLSRRTGARIFLKREDLQPVFSFKLRGAYNKMVHLGRERLQRGVICSSAGNHAQGVALAAQRLHVRAVIVMPDTTPSIKVDAVRRRGAEVDLFGDSYDDAFARACERVEKEGLVFIPPFDDPDIIAGQGTIGMEILRQYTKKIDAVFCAVGGGGLISGVAAYIKALRPQVKIVGVEAVDANSLARSLEKGERIALKSVGLFADGAAVKMVGEETFRLCQEYVDEVVCVDNDAICAAIKDVFEDTRSILEPAGALAIAGCKEWLAHQENADKTVVAVASGANMNFDRLRFVAERAELGEQRECILAVTIPERPGSFKEFCSLLGDHTITEFNYRYSEVSAAHVFVGISVHARDDALQVVDDLRNRNLSVLNLSDDEMAKSHLRHMVGGHAPTIHDEVLYRFVFPERPGALLKFLQHLQSNWNISLFHYRNHGADFGRVLVGMQVPQGDRHAFEIFLDGLGYEYIEETVNPAYRLFLG